MGATRVEAIRQRLQEAFAPLELEVIDESHRHAGHAGARDGRGHFDVRIVSAAFAGMAPLARRQVARAEHLARLQALRDEGRLLLAGPCPAIDAEDPGPAGFSGSLVVARFDSLEDARAWADADPYCAAGVYARVDVRPFRKVLP